MTTLAPDPASILAHQIIKLEGTLHLLNAKTRFNEEHNPHSTGTRLNSHPTLDSPCLWTLLMLLILIMSLRPTHAYTYSYFDCSQPAHLETFDRLTLCQQTPTDTTPGHDPIETWLLLQIIEKNNLQNLYDRLQLPCASPLPAPKQIIL
jgi:hypothetical protein